MKDIKHNNIITMALEVSASADETCCHIEIIDCGIHFLPTLLFYVYYSVINKL